MLRRAIVDRLNIERLKLQLEADKKTERKDDGTSVGAKRPNGKTGLKRGKVTESQGNQSRSEGRGPEPKGSKSAKLESGVRKETETEKENKSIQYKPEKEEKDKKDKINSKTKKSSKMERDERIFNSNEQGIRKHLAEKGKNAIPTKQ